LFYAAKDIHFEVPEKPFAYGERMSKSILIADDHETTRSLIRSFLESKEGFEVCGEAVDGVDVIEKAKDLKPDLIILDLAMPRMNGAAAASVLKRTMPNVPIILFTMYDEVMGKALAAGGACGPSARQTKWLARYGGARSRPASLRIIPGVI
jgi:CheY-like chemotaxis protein